MGKSKSHKNSRRASLNSQKSRYKGLPSKGLLMMRRVKKHLLKHPNDSQARKVKFAGVN